MKPVTVLACLITLGLGSCSWIPRAGPSASEVVEQSRSDGEILFDVVEVDNHVVSTLRAQPKESFAAHFTQDTAPPLFNIAIGDTISVLIWESAAGGLFTEAPPALSPSGARTGIEPLAPESPRQEPGAPAPPGGQRRAEGLAGAMLLSEAAGSRAVQIPDQVVESDGAISVPYAGRIPAAGRLPAEVQQTIEARLAGRALQPQALVIVKKSFANAVTVLLNETGAGRPVSLGGSSNRYLAGNPSGPAVAAAAAAVPVTSAAEAASTRVPLSPGGDRLLQVIATAGGAQAPVHEVFVRLSRGGMTATIPLQQLVSDPAENVYARPGDVLSLIRVPQTFSVFGATGRNAEIPFSAAKISLSEALGKSQGLRDDLAKPEGVFLFRYEPNSVVRALDQPTASGSGGGVSPIVYRFNLRDANSYLLAGEFPMRDKDVLFVADAPAARIYKFFTALNQVTGPIVTGLVTCHYANC